MCEILDQIENRGKEIGIQQGEEKSFLLIEKLCSFGMFDDIKKISTDKEYRHQLMRQMGIE